MRRYAVHPVPPGLAADISVNSVVFQAGDEAARENA
jgi:hypothetical protein